MRILRTAVILFCLCWCAAAPAQTELGRTVREMSLQDCIELALKQNLDIQITRYQNEYAAYDLALAYAGYDPNFSISGRHTFNLSGGGLDPNTGLINPTRTSDANVFNSSVGGQVPVVGTKYNLFANIAESYGNVGTTSVDNTSGQAGISLTQPLLKDFWIDGARVNIRVARLAIKAADQKVRGQILDTIKLVEQAYYNLIATRETVKVQEEALQLAEQQLSEDKKRVEVGALAPLSETQSESQAASVRANLISAMQAVGTAETTLKQLIAADYAEWVKIEIQPTESLPAPVQVFDLQESWRRALTDRPDVLSAKLELERRGVVLKYSRNQIFPELDLVGSYGHNTGGGAIREFDQGFGELRRGNHPFYSYGAQLSIPLGNKAARSRYKTAKADVEVELLNLKKLEQDIMGAIHEDIGQARANYLKIESTREATKYAVAALDAERRKLENGKSTSFEVLSLQTKLTTARSDEINALSDYNKTLSQLAHDEATTFQRRNIDVKVGK
jgi:outer membrane protein